MFCTTTINPYWMTVLTWCGWGFTIILAIFFLILVVERVAIKENALGDGLKKMFWFILVLFGVSVLSSVYLLVKMLICR